MPEIKIYFFSSCDDRHQSQVTKAIFKVVSESSLKIFEEAEIFAGSVEKEVVGEVVLLMIIRNEKELNTLLKHQKQFKDHPILLILWETDRGGFRKAFRLYPRYAGCFKDDYDDLLQILKKMSLKMKF